MNRDDRAGMTLVELVVVFALVAAMMTMAVTTFSNWTDNQRASTSARSVADAFSLARAEALRTGNNHILAFNIEDGLGGISNDVVIVNDGPPATANCIIQSGEIVHSFALEQGVRFGTDPNLSDEDPAPDDPGSSGDQANGSSFTDADAGDASWVAFGPDGLPRRFTEGASTSDPCDDITAPGVAGGAIYLTNGHRDYAVVLTPLGAVRLHRWIGGGDAWTN